MMAKNNKHERQHIVIVGASHAGVQLAVSLREAGFKDALTLVSGDAHTPYHRPPLSKAFLKEDDLPVQILRADDYYKENKIDLLKSSRVISIDPANRRIEFSQGKSLTYSKLCLATGALPRPLDVAGIKSKEVYELRDCDDARLLRNATRVHKKVVVIGGGFIGLEAAATMRGLGMDVSVVEATSRLMGRAVAPQISQFVLDKFREWGIKVFLDTPVTRIETENDIAVGVMCGERHISAHMVLVGIGVVPDDKLAIDAGLTTGNGIHVDEKFETSASNIYAIGDVCAYQHWLVDKRIRLESVQNATDQARNLANTLTQNHQPYRAVPWFWSDQGDMKIQMVGLSHHSKTIITREKPERNSFSAFHYDDGDNLVAIDTINAPADHMAGRMLIAQGISPTFSQAADPDFRLKGLL